MSEDFCENVRNYSVEVPKMSGWFRGASLNLKIPNFLSHFSVHGNPLAFKDQFSDIFVFTKRKNFWHFYPEPTQKEIRSFQFGTSFISESDWQLQPLDPQNKPVPEMFLDQDHLCPNRSVPRCDWLSHLLPRAAVAADSKIESHSLMLRADIFNLNKIKIIK